MQILISIIGGFILGWFIREAVAMHKIKGIVKTIEEKEQPQKPNELRVKIEKHKDMFYLFSEADDMFIAQGATKDEVTEVLKKRYSAITVVADPDNVKEVGFK
jgi:hypothetical protein